MDKDKGPVIVVCSDCGREILVAPGEGGVTEVHEVFKQNRRWDSSPLRITKEKIPLNACPFRRCESPHIQTINNSKAQRIWEKIQAARQQGAT